MVEFCETITIPFLLFLISRPPTFAQNVIKPVTGPNDSPLRYEADLPQHTIASKIGGLDLSSLTSKLSNVTTLDAQLFPDENHMKFMRKTATDVDWYGEDDDGDSMNLIIDGGGKFYGSVNFEGHVYTIKTLPDGYTQVDRIDEFPPEDVPHHNPLLGRRRRRRQRKLRGSQQPQNRELDSQEDDGSIIDVMCIYTINAMCAEAGYGNTNSCSNSATNRAPMDAKCQLAIAETNHAYENSGIDTVMRLVHTDVVLHEDMSTNGFSNLLDELTDRNDGVMDEVHGWRDVHRADLVALITENSAYCGLGWMFSNDDALGFSVSARACMTGYYTFGHETGHNMGCKHDRTTHGHTSTASYPNSNYGYRDPQSRYRTIMAYRCPGGCPKLQRFSNDELKVSFQGQQVVAGNAYNDCAKQINSVKRKVARFRQSLDDSSGGGGGNGGGGLTTPAPTPAPTNSPGPTSCGNDQIMFELNLKTDQYGSETTWKLQDSNNGSVLSQGGPYTQFDDVTFRKCLNRNQCYEFLIQDSWADGICCSGGPGEYTVKLDGTVVKKGGDFGAEDIVPLNCDDGSIPTTDAPTTAPTVTATVPPTTEGSTSCDDADQVEFKLDLTTDRYGRETTWKLTTNDGIDVVAQNSRQYGEFDNDLHTQCISRDECYSFTIEDSWGDGMCCTHGQGQYIVFLDGNEVRRGGDFLKDDTFELNCNAGGSGGGSNTNTSPTCGAGKVEFKLNLKTDTYGHETSWELQKGTNNDQVVVSSRPYGQFDEDVVEQCLDEDECYTFVIEDSWGDGMCCTFGDGEYTVSYGGVEVKNGSSFGREEKVYLNCDNQELVT